MKRALTSKVRGFTLLEVSVALLVLGLLSFTLWKLLPQIRAVDETRPAGDQLAFADEAIQGFIMKHYRLPCPDTDDDGKENVVSATGGCANAKGDLPFHTLGLSLPTRLRYGVYQGAIAARSLTVAMERYTPPLPPSLATPSFTSNNTEWPLNNVATPPTPPTPAFPPLPPPPSPSLPALTPLAMDWQRDPLATLASTQLNGLDFCEALRQNAEDTFDQARLNANGLHVAYALAHPGVKDADADGNLFDKDNAQAGMAFEPPTRPAAQDYDDTVLAIGFGELAARLSCTALVSRANAAGHMARATFDHYRIALAHLQIRAFALDRAYFDAQSAYTGLLAAVLNTVSAVVTETAIEAAQVITADEAPPPPPINIPASVALVAAKTQMDTAFQRFQTTTVPTLTDAVSARIEAQVYAHKLLTASNHTAQQALDLDKKGLLP